MLKTTFDIPGKPFAEDNKHEWDDKQLLVARRTSHGDGEPTVFFEIASVGDGYIHTQMGEIFRLSDCQCWWPMPTPIFSHG